MVDENKMEKVETEKVEEKMETNDETVKVEVPKEDTKTAEVKEEKKAEDSKDENKTLPKSGPSIDGKDIAVANGYSLKISPKYSFSICKVIKHKTPEAAIKRLEEAAAGKRAIPMSGREVAHQKGKGMSGGKFPKNACNEIAAIVKQVKANATNAGIDNPVITIAQANKASGPFRSGGRRGKRAHIHLEVMDKSKLVMSPKNSSRKGLNKGVKK